MASQISACYHKDAQLERAATSMLIHPHHHPQLPRVTQPDVLFMQSVSHSDSESVVAQICLQDFQVQTPRVLVQEKDGYAEASACLSENTLTHWPIILQSTMMDMARHLGRAHY